MKKKSITQKKRIVSVLLVIFCFGWLVPDSMLEASAAGYTSIVKEDFSHITDGTPLAVAGAQNEGDWKLYYYSVASQTNDPVVYYDGGLKITKSAKGGYFCMYKDMTGYNVPTTGKLVYSFDAKFKNPQSNYFSDHLFRVGSAFRIDRLNDDSLMWSGVIAGGGVNMFPLTESYNTPYMKSIFGTEDKLRHFEYIIDYDSNTYQVKIDDTYLTYSNKNEFAIPDGFKTGGGGKVFQIDMRHQSVASIDDFIIELKNFSVTSGETMWPEANAVTVSDITADSVTLSWNPLSVAGVAGYDIYANNSLVKSVSGGNTKVATIDGLLADTNYVFKIKPVFENENSYDTEPTISVNTGGFLARENKFNKISAGRSHTLGINMNGKLKAFGDNSFNQLNSSLTDLKDVSAGGDSSFAVDNDGNVWSWGNNYSGQLGLGKDVLIQVKPTKINGIENVKKISAGSDHVIALTENGSVYSWGDNRYGQLGFEAEATYEPTLIGMLEDKDITDIYTGSDNSFAISRDGSLYGWGMNYIGQLGDGDEKHDNKYTPIEIDINGLKVLSVAAGGGHTVALCSNGEEKSVWVWGSNSRAQHGTGDASDFSNIPVRLEFFDGMEIVKIAAGEAHSLALLEDGSLYAWGWNEDGQLGIGDVAFGLTPTLVNNLPKICDISAGYDFSVALAENGTFWAWGANDYNQINTTEVQIYNQPISVLFKMGKIAAGNLSFIDGDKIYENIPDTSGEYTLNVSYYNNTDANYEGKVLIAFYDGDRLISVKTTDVSLQSKVETPVTCKLLVPQKSADIFTKIFVWDSSLVPYSEIGVVR